MANQLVASLRRQIETFGVFLSVITLFRKREENGDWSKDVISFFPSWLLRGFMFYV